MNKVYTLGLLVMVFLLTINLAISGKAIAGSLDSTGSPSEGSGMPTLKQIYDRLDTGADITITNSFQNPTSGPTAGTGKTLVDIQSRLPQPDNTNGATASHVLSGKTFWSLRTDGTWGLQTGTATAGSNVTGANGSLTIPIPDGMYSGGKTATASDTNLTAGNIKNGVTIFGITGTYTGGYTCPTGDLSPQGRWCDNGDGTVRDMTTGLIWLRNAKCDYFEGVGIDWLSAMYKTPTLKSGDCGLNDGSSEGDWRLPTIKELQDITTGTEYIRASSMYKFENVSWKGYWSSTITQLNSQSQMYDAKNLEMLNGSVGIDNISLDNPVLPVRSGR